MSIDPNQNMPPMGHVPPKKSGGALKWILGGLGCFGLLVALCFGGFGYLTYAAYQDLMANSAYLEGRTSLETSQSLADAVGDPVTVGEPVGPPSQTQRGQRVTLVYSVPVSGSKGSGTGTIQVEGQFLSDDWTLESLTAEVDGKEIPIDGNMLDIDIEGEDDVDAEGE